MFFVKAVTSLAGGCTMVIKPADQTPLSALFYDHLAKKAGVPDEMLNVVTGYGTTSGAAISSHMDIDQVNFTGSTEVGRLIMQAASLSNLKKVSLQLGGKSPIIIFNDADVDKAAKLAFLGAVVNKGEICGLAARIVTNNLNTANTVSRSMRPGVISINCYFDFDRYCPFGGYKMSQYGKDWCMNALYKYSAI